MLDKSIKTGYNTIRKREREEKTMVKKLNKMIDNIIKIYGFEHENTIYFCKMAERCLYGKINFKYIQLEYEKLLKNT